MTPYEGAERKNADGARMQARDIGVVEGSVCVPGRTGEVPPQGAFLAQPRTESPNHECDDGRSLAQRCTIELRGCPGSVVQHQNKGESPAPDPQALLRRPRQPRGRAGELTRHGRSRGYARPCPVAQPFAPSGSSTQINGLVAQRGEEIGIDVTHHRRVNEIIKRIEKGELVPSASCSSVVISCAPASNAKDMSEDEAARRLEDHLSVSLHVFLH